MGEADTLSANYSRTAKTFSVGPCLAISSDTNNYKSSAFLALWQILLRRSYL